MFSINKLSNFTIIGITKQTKNVISYTKNAIIKLFVLKIIIFKF